MSDTPHHPLTIQRRFKHIGARLFWLSGLTLLPAWMRKVLAWIFWIIFFGFALVLLVLRYWILPDIENYRGDIEQALSKAAGLHVTIEKIDTDWRGLRPHLSLYGLKLDDAAGRPALSLSNVETEVAWSSLLHFQLRLHRLEFNAPSLDIRREIDGAIFIAGLPLNTEVTQGPGFSDWLLAQDKIVVRNATIEWNDALRAAPPLTLNNLNFMLLNDGNQHRFGLNAEPPSALATRLDIRGDFQGDDFSKLDKWTGEAYAELDYADLAGWRAWVNYPIEVPQGAGGVRLWLGFADQRLNALTTDIALRDVKVRLGPDLPMLDLAQLSGRLAGSLNGQFEESFSGQLLKKFTGESWQGAQGGFELSAKKLMLATRDGIKIPPTDFSIRSSPAVGQRPAHGEVAATGLDIDVLTQLATYLPIDTFSRKLLGEYAPHGRIQDLRLAWRSAVDKQGANQTNINKAAVVASTETNAPAPAPSSSSSSSILAGLVEYTLHARFDGLGINAVGQTPGFSKLSGRVEADEKGGQLNLDSQQSSLYLPTVFADPRIDFETLTAQAIWKVNQGRVDAQLKHLNFKNKDAVGEASGRFLSASMVSNKGTTRTGNANEASSETSNEIANSLGEIDLVAKVTRADATAVWRYIPLEVSQNVSDWLKTSIKAGHAEDAHLQLKGDLRDFPFADGKTGIFKITGKIVDASLRYADSWPAINNIHGDFLFEGLSMRIRAERGDIFGVKLSKVVAETPNLDAHGAEILTVTGLANGPTKDFLKFIDASPVAAKIDNFTAAMKAEGNGNLDLKIVMPLEHVDDTTLVGRYDFVKNRLTIDADLPALTDVNGQLQFTGNSIGLKDTRANLMGSPLTINAETKADGVVGITTVGTLNIAELRKNLDNRLLDSLSGSTSWRGNIMLRKKNTEVVLESNLQGIASTLPEPFNKTANETLALRFERSPFSAEGPRRRNNAGGGVTGAGSVAAAPATTATTATQISAREQTRFTLGKVVSAQIVKRRVDAGVSTNGAASTELGKMVVERGLIVVGETALPSLPDKGVLLSATLKSLNLDFWRNALKSSKGKEAALSLSSPASSTNTNTNINTKNALPINALNLRTSSMTAFDRPFSDVVLRANLQDDTWQAQLLSKEVSGDLSWKAQGQGRLKARLKQLVVNDAQPLKQIPSTPAKTVVSNVAVVPSSSTTSVVGKSNAATTVKNSVANNVAAAATIQPPSAPLITAIEEPLRELPGLDIVADSFVLRGKKLGRLELQAANEINSWRIEKLTLTNPDGALNADGAWRSGATQLNFKFDVTDIGKMLERLGYVDAVKRGTAKLEGRVSWKGAPTEIDYPTLDGALSVEAAKGQFNKLEPGIGKLLGILSLQSLPRRISLDFRDVFSEGFAFDSIKGNVKSVHGILSTQDLHIQGPAAKVFMKGEASIPSETQNLRVRIQPALGDGVALGAMVINPVIGLAAWAAQKVLRDPLDQIFAFEYEVTGSWSDPKVEKLGGLKPPTLLPNGAPASVPPLGPSSTPSLAPTSTPLVNMGTGNTGTAGTTGTIGKPGSSAGAEASPPTSSPPPPPSTQPATSTPAGTNP